MIGVKDKHGRPIEAIGYHKSLNRLQTAYWQAHSSMRAQPFKESLMKKHMERNGRTFGYFEIKEKGIND